MGAAMCENVFVSFFYITVKIKMNFNIMGKLLFIDTLLKIMQQFVC